MSENLLENRYTPFAMEKVKLGSQGAAVCRMGLGCMGMNEFYGVTAGEMAELEAAMPESEIVGQRYGEANVRAIDRCFPVG